MSENEAVIYALIIIEGIPAIKCETKICTLCTANNKDYYNGN